MSLSFQMMALGVAVIVFAMIGILLLLPANKARQVRRRKEDAEKANPAKNWEETSLRLERHIQALRRELEEAQKKERLFERDSAVQKEKYAKLQEKLAQERDWQKREEDDAQKKVKEITTLKTTLRTMEDDLNVTHADRLKFERQLREVKEELESVIVARRNLELQVQKLEAQTESQQKQIKDLKWDNSQLSNKLADKKEAESWVPMQDFQKLQEELRNKEKELTRLKEQAG